MFQAPNTNFSTIKPLVSGTVRSLEQLKEDPEISEQLITESLKNGVYQEIKLQLTDTVLSEFSTSKKKYLENTTANLKKRFPESDTRLLSKLEVLNPNTCPAEASLLKTFGDKEILELAEHY